MEKRKGSACMRIIPQHSTKPSLRGTLIFKLNKVCKYNNNILNDSLLPWLPFQK